MTLTQYSTSVENDEIHCRNLKDGHEVSISFQRTVRVPDNSNVSSLPPTLGEFPLYKVQDYRHTLPPKMCAKGGLFLPIYRKYQRPIMRISF